MRRTGLISLLLFLAGTAWAQDPPLPGAGVAGAVQGEVWQGHGFAQHLKEAIALNQLRAPLYAARSGGASRCVSRRLVLLEQLTRPFAWLTDQRAKKWNARGVGIVRDDFVPMSGAAPWDRPVRFRGRMTEAQQETLSARLSRFRDELGDLVEADDFAGAARRTHQELQAVEALEQTWGCHLAMTLHVLEQIGFVAANCKGYVEQDPEVASFARKFVRRMGWGLPASPGLDRDAQAAHAFDAGVILNDVPPIPFRAACARAGISLD